MFMETPVVFIVVEDIGDVADGAVFCAVDGEGVVEATGVTGLIETGGIVCTVAVVAWVATGSDAELPQPQKRHEQKTITTHNAAVFPDMTDLPVSPYPYKFTCSTPGRVDTQFLQRLWRDRSAGKFSPLVVVQYHCRDSVRRRNNWC
jgi:hypothetical protein